MDRNFKVFDKMLEGVQVINKDWNYIYLNDVAISHSKLTREQLLNHSITEIYPGIEKTELFSIMESVVNTGLGKNMSNKFDYPDKSVGYFELYVEPIEEGVMIFSFDVTKQKLHEENLQITNLLLEKQNKLVAEQSETLKKSLTEKTDAIEKLNKEREFIEALFQYSTEGLLLTNSNGEIIRINPNVTKMFGYTANELLGKKIEILLPQRLTSKHELHRETYNESPHPRAMGLGINLLAKRKDNSEFPVEISLSPFAKKGEPFVISFITDITLRKQNEDDLRKRKEDLKNFAENLKQINQRLEQESTSLSKSLEEKTNLIQEIHHRVRNNLQVIISLIHLQSNNIKSKSLESIFQSFETKIDTMALVYNMTYTKGNLLNINLINFINNYKSYLINTFRDINITFKVDFNLNQDYVNIDTAISFGLLINEILTNSVKFGHSNQNTCIISLLLKDDGEHNYTLQIKDSGSGIPENVIERNDEFIGLSLIDDLVDQLDGTYKRSSNNQGTCYDIIFKEIHR